MRILLSNCWNPKYAGNHTELVLRSIAENSSARAEHYIIHGKEAPAHWFMDNNISYEHISWVEDYAELLRSIDVQIFPIAIGTGTKGKVLSALASGVISIGSAESFANIRAQLGWPHLSYQLPTEVGAHIAALTFGSINYRKMTRTETVHELHHPDKISEAFWRLLGND
jgi:hypothetical protein